MLSEKLITQPGDLIQLVSPTNKTFIFQLSPGGQLQTHRGVLNHDDLIGKRWGSQVATHIGSIYTLLQPGLGDILRETRRNTQIMYPKDIGFTLLTMGIGPGTKVIEAGTGSGAFTTALAWSVGTEGRVYSYEVRADMLNLARKNLQKVGLDARVVLKLQDIAQGFEEVNVDAVFLDLPDPYDYLEQVKHALKPGGYFGSILPTSNQVTRLISALQRSGFAFIDVCEIFLRYYKPVAERFRPTDRMVAHTGFLIFARLTLQNEDTEESIEGKSTSI